MLILFFFFIYDESLWMKRASRAGVRRGFTPPRCFRQVPIPLKQLRCKWCPLQQILQPTTVWAQGMCIHAQRCTCISCCKPRRTRRDHKQLYAQSLKPSQVKQREKGRWIHRSNQVCMLFASAWRRAPKIPNADSSTSCWILSQVCMTCVIVITFSLRKSLWTLWWPFFSKKWKHQALARW